MGGNTQYYQVSAVQLLWVVFFGVLSSCSGETAIKVTLAEKRAAATAAKVTPPFAKPSEVVTVTGKDFLASKAYKAVFKVSASESKQAPMSVVNDTTATFVMPEGVGAGEKNFDIIIGQRTINSFSIVATDGSGVAYYSGDASEICSTRSFMNKSGKVLKGTMDCVAGSVVDCTTDGQTGCRTTATFKAADIGSIVAADLRSGKTLAGISGSLAECSTNGVQGCVTTATYQSADLTNLTAANIKSGVTIAGQAGDFPSATNTLSGASITADLDAATFNAKVKSATAFEYWNASGVRQTGAGDAEITDVNIANTIDIFGTTGNYTGSSPNAWDLRAGVTIGSTTGKLQVNCRNGATLSRYDQGAPQLVSGINTVTDYLTTATNHGYSDNQTVRINYSFVSPGGLDYTATYFVRNSTLTTFQLSTSSGGAAIDITSGGTGPIMVYRFQLSSGTTNIWDSIDDYFGAASATPTYTGWTAANNVCGSGIEATSDDERVWKDVTIAGTGAASCTGSPENCSLKDKISGLEWQKTDATNRNWSSAQLYCDDLTYNTKSDWRLPTQKELMSAYIDGMMSTANATGWMTSGTLQQEYWSSSSMSDINVYAWTSSPGYGWTSYTDKFSIAPVICVRP